MDAEQRLKELERRRRRGARLLSSGVAQAQVARRIGVARRGVFAPASEMEYRPCLSVPAHRCIGPMGDRRC